METCQVIFVLTPALREEDYYKEEAQENIWKTLEKHEKTGKQVKINKIVEDKPKYYIVSFLGGKDSTAMLLRMLELGNYQIDEVINCDTGMEFPALYKHISKIKDIVEARGIKFTTLKAEKNFQYYLSEHSYHKKDGTLVKGYGWTRSRARWCTSLLKTFVIRVYLKDLKSTYDVYQYVGLANDEQYRLERA